MPDEAMRKMRPKGQVALAGHVRVKRHNQARMPQVALGVAVLFALSACGSTVQQGDGVAQGGPRAGNAGTPEELDLRGSLDAGEELARGSSAGSRSDDVAASSDPAGEHEVSGQAVPEGSAPTRPAAGSTETVTTPSPGATSRGFTEDELYIGYGTWKGFSAAAGALGVDNIDQGDHEGQAKAVIDDINARGGVAGRKIIPVFHDYNDGSNGVTNAQAACTRWTEDRPVFAVVNLIGSFDDETLAGCLATHQTPLVQLTAQVIRPRRVYSHHAPFLWAPGQPAMERAVPVWLRRLAANDYFEPWDANTPCPTSDVKIGLLLTGGYSPDWDRILREGLSRQGRSVASTFEFSSQAQLNNAVLRFRSECVTHVFGQGVELSFFALAAESQGYRPRYAVNSANNVAAWELVVPEQQRRGAIGVGWLPLDVPRARDPEGASAAEVRCRQIMEEGGQDTTNHVAFTLMVRVCDGFHFAAATISAGGLSPTGVQRGANAMGSMPSASTFRVAFPNGRPDGAAAVRDLAHLDECSCFFYLSRTDHDM